MPKGCNSIDFPQYSRQITNKTTFRIYWKDYIQNGFNQLLSTSKNKLLRITKKFEYCNRILIAPNGEKRLLVSTFRNYQIQFFFTSIS